MVYSNIFWWEKKRFYRNNNVLIELGFAIGCLEKENIIIFADNIDDAPFDLRNLRMTKIESPVENIEYIIKCTIENKQKTIIINKYKNFCKFCLSKKPNDELESIKIINKYSIICRECKSTINLKLTDFSLNANLFPRGDWDDEYDARVNIKKLKLLLTTDQNFKKYISEKDFEFINKLDKKMETGKKIDEISLKDFIDKIFFTGKFNQEDEIFIIKLIELYNNLLRFGEFNFEIFDKSLIFKNSIVEFLIIKLIPNLIVHYNGYKINVVKFTYDIIRDLGKKLFLLKDNIIMLNFIDTVFNDLLCPCFNYGTYKLSNDEYNNLFRMMSYCFVLSNEYGKINILDALFHLKYKCKNKITVNNKKFDFDLVIEQVILQGIMLSKKLDTFEVEKVYKERLDIATIYFGNVVSMY